MIDEERACEACEVARVDFESALGEDSVSQALTSDVCAAGIRHAVESMARIPSSD